MATINSVHIAGRLARDPRINAGEGWTQALITVCTTDKFKTRGGEDKEVTEFHNVTLWNEDAVHAEKYLKKGTPVSIEGRIKSDKWKDKSTGLERTRIGIQVITIMYLEKMAPLPKSSPDEPAPMIRPSYAKAPADRPKQAVVEKPQTTTAPPNDEEYDELPF